MKTNHMSFSGAILCVAMSVTPLALSEPLEIKKTESAPPGPYLPKKIAEKIRKEQIFFNNKAQRGYKKPVGMTQQYPDIVGVDTEKPHLKFNEVVPEIKKTQKKEANDTPLKVEQVKDADAVYLFPRLEDQSKPDRKKIEKLFADHKPQYKHLPKKKTSPGFEQGGNYQNFWDIQPEEEPEADLNQYPPMSK